MSYEKSTKFWNGFINSPALDDPTIDEFIEEMDNVSKQMLTLRKESETIELQFRGPGHNVTLRFHNVSELLFFLNGLIFVRKFFKDQIIPGGLSEMFKLWYKKETGN